MSEGIGYGKVILLGEHAVVHGAPAVAAAVRLHAKCSATAAGDGISRMVVRDASGAVWPHDDASDLHRAFCALLKACNVDRPVHVAAELTVPTRVGLGSSAALGVAATRALLGFANGSPVQTAQLMQAAASWEQVFHGNPSGIDVAVAAMGGCIQFMRHKAPEPLTLSQPLTLCMVDSGARAPTREMVAHVSGILAREPLRAQRFLGEIASLVDRARAALKTGDRLELGQAMNRNHELLRELGASTEPIERLRDIALRFGSAGAKVTGAGGGGCVVAVAPDEPEQLIAAWQQEGFRAFRAQVAWAAQ